MDDHCLLRESVEVTGQNKNKKRKEMDGSDVVHQLDDRMQQLSSTDLDKTLNVNLITQFSIA